MTWADFYLACFLVGFILSVLSFLAGTGHMHLPHVHMHVHGVHVGHAHVSGGGGGARGIGRGQLPWFNFGTISAFLAWFGGAGYLLEHYYHVWYFLAFAVATFSGLGAAAAVFVILARVFMAHEAPLDPADYEMVGVLGKLSLPIRTGGTGELIYSQEGTRHVAGARSEDGAAIPKGAEVVVTRYEKGIAYVRRWEDMAGETELRN
jgi:membrane protein implicated in regulation of membrane protease activity